MSQAVGIAAGSDRTMALGGRIRAEIIAESTKVRPGSTFRAEAWWRDTSTLTGVAVFGPSDAVAQMAQYCIKSAAGTEVASGTAVLFSEDRQHGSRISWVVPKVQAAGDYTLEVSLPLGPYQDTLKQTLGFMVEIPVTGDANNDGQVTLADLAPLATKHHLSTDSPYRDPFCDQNSDSVVDLYDLVITAKALSQ